MGIDLGGTKTEIVALADDGRVLHNRRVPTPRGDYEATLDAVARLVAGAEEVTGRSGTVGIGIPGAVSPETGLVKNANSTWLIGHPLDRDLEARLGRPVRVMNDADCFALSEAVDGAAAGAGVVFGVILGTGVGGGIVLDGRPYRGASLIAGEWGHNPLPWPRDDERPGPECYCGRRGCIESFCSGPGLERDYARAEAPPARGGAAPAGSSTRGRTPSAREIGTAARDGDPRAEAAVERYVDRLARGLATVINVLDPHVVVLGGGVSGLPRLAGRVQAALPPWVFSDAVAARVVPARHGASSGVRGAAWLWPRAE